VSGDWLSRRYGALVSALDGSDTATATIAEAVAAVESAPGEETTWLVLATLSGHLPTEREVQTAHRTMQLNGVRSVIESSMTAPGRLGALRRQPAVEVLRNAVIIDIMHTAETELATGIQRVARETVRRWNTDHDVVFVTWRDDRRSLRRLTSSEHARALYGTHATTKDKHVGRMPIVVPWQGHFLLPELAAEPWRTERIAALARFSRARSGVIGFDCVPLTSVETVADGMASHFAWNLGAVAHMDRVASISRAAGIEYGGWRRMLAPTGIAGPEIETVFLPSEAEDATDEALAKFKTMIGYNESDPLVLVVGSHEPRKNHMAVLSAAETLWLEGHRFQLVFVGGNSWNSRAFTAQITRMHSDKRTVLSISGIADPLLWAAYRLARFTVFPSVNEGFGLPVGESLSAGTPVVTSQHGSMREIAELAGGAVLVNPYDDDSVADGMRSLIENDVLLARLRLEALNHPTRGWDDYAAELWDYFVVRD
jgi:glycosyltransferase involved in cell wall biosynthesis